MSAWPFKVSQLFFSAKCDQDSLLKMYNIGGNGFLLFSENYANNSVFVDKTIFVKKT